MADVDLLVIGAGAAGLAAARAGVRAGRRVALAEQGRPGGDCTHFGCVPSKGLLAAAHRAHDARSAAELGVHADVAVDGRAVMRRVRALAGEIEQDESVERLQSEGIRWVAGRARFAGRDAVAVDGQLLRPRRIVIATGARATVPDVPSLDRVPYLTNREVFALQDLPAHLVVVGGGAVGCELAQAFRRLGSQVTLVESGPRLLGSDEPEASSALRQRLDADGVDLRLGSALRAVGRERGRLVAQLDDGQRVAGSHLLIATGRTADTDGLGLAEAGVAVDEHGRVVVDDRLRTTNPAVYAVGDCASALTLTHVADEQGRLAAQNAFAPWWRPGLLGGRRHWSMRVVPRVAYTQPEVARVGLTEAEAFASFGARARVAFVPLAAMDRPRTDARREGFVKLIAAPTGRLPLRVLDRLVGMTAVGPAAGELVAEGALAMQLQAPVGRIAQTTHAYPTFALTTRVAAALFFGSYGGATERPARADEGST